LTVGAPQVLAEGWAAPLKGFMREGVLAQTLHFRSVLVNEGMAPDTVDATTLATNFADVDAARPRVRVSMPLPIVLPITGYTKRLVESHEKGSAGVALVDKLGRTLVSRPFPSWNRSILTEIYLCHACSCQEILRTAETAGQAILRRPEIYAHRKEELIARTFGVIDPQHPYIKLVSGAGEWLIGGEIELLQPIRYHDGLDEYHLRVISIMIRHSGLTEIYLCF
jgi:3'-phosphoadenosine 5'-phosphosulfate synthase